MSASGHSLTSTIIGFNDDKKKNIKSLTFQQIEESEAVKTLSELLELYRKGLSMPLAFFPEAAKEGMEKVLLNENDEAMAAMKEKFHENFGEATDQYISRVWPRWTEMLGKNAFDLAEEVMLKALDAEYRKW